MEYTVWFWDLQGRTKINKQERTQWETASMEIDMMYEERVGELAVFRLE